jgi:branched-chain amino acid transport system ATP-binding protein
MLSLRNLSVRYDGVRALRDVSIDVDKGSITSLIGANGAGKSTTLKAISGLVPVSSGEIWFEGQRIDGKPPEKIVSLGIGHVPEGKQLFLEMSVRDNLLTGAHLRKDQDRLEQDLERIYGYFPVLREARHRKASTLSGGEQQMLAIGRGLMSNPKLLLLDEPSLGLSPIITREVGSIINRIAEEGVSILLIEQNANLALQLARMNYVMETGTIALQGESEVLQNNEHVRAAYLGLTAGDEELDLLPEEHKDREEEPPQQRWQDQGTQERWQDRGPQARWQEAGPKVVIPGGRVEAGEIQEAPDQGLESRAEPSPEGEVRDRWGEIGSALEEEPRDRWTEDRRAVGRLEETGEPGRRLEGQVLDRWGDRSRWGERLGGESPDRWATEKQAQQQGSSGRWPPERGAPDRGGESWEQRGRDRWPERREPPSRVVKRTFVPEVRSKGGS